MCAAALPLTWRDPCSRARRSVSRSVGRQIRFSKKIRLRRAESRGLKRAPRYPNFWTANNPPPCRSVGAGAGLPPSGPPLPPPRAPRSRVGRSVLGGPSVGRSVGRFTSSNLFRRPPFGSVVASVLGGVALGFGRFLPDYRIIGSRFYSFRLVQTSLLPIVQGCARRLTCPSSCGGGPCSSSMSPTLSLTSPTAQACRPPWGLGAPIQRPRRPPTAPSAPGTRAP